MRSPASVISPRVDGDVEEISRRDRDVVSAPRDLVRPVAEHLVEDRGRDRHEVGVGDPGAVEAAAGLADLVLLHLGERASRSPPDRGGTG